LEPLELNTPVKLHEVILGFCREIDPTQRPVFLDVTPTLESYPVDCLDNVRREVAKHGGSIQHGWIIWEAPGSLLEAVFHAVWRSPEGKLVDVTPQFDGETRILFLPDSQRTFEDGIVENIQKPLADTPEVREVLRIRKEIDKERRAFHKGERTFALEQRHKSGEQSYRKVASVGRNDPCSCGSGKKYKHCHGRVA